MTGTSLREAIQSTPPPAGPAAPPGLTQLGLPSLVGASAEAVGAQSRGPRTSGSAETTGILHQLFDAESQGAGGTPRAARSRTPPGRDREAHRAPRGPEPAALQPSGEALPHSNEVRMSEPEDPLVTMTENFTNELICGNLKRKGIPPKVQQELAKIVKDWIKRIQRLVQTRERKDKIAQDFAEFSAGRYPAGSKPFGLAFQCQELDSSIAADVITLNIRGLDGSLQLPSSGITFRELKAAMHLAHLKWQKEVDLNVITAQITAMTAELQFSLFTEAIKKPFESLITHVDELGLGIPQDLLGKEDLAFLIAKAQVQFKELVGKIVETEKAKKVKAEALKKKDADSLKLLTEKSPEEVVKMAVRQEIHEELKRKGKGKGTQPKPNELPETRLFSSALQAVVSAQPMDPTVVAAAYAAAPKPQQRRLTKAQQSNKTTTVPQKPKCRVCNRPLEQHPGHQWCSSQGKGSGKGKGKGKGQGKGKGKDQAKGKSKGKGKDTGMKGKGRGRGRGTTV